MADKPIVGIDVSKEWVDLCTSQAAGVERIANTPEAVAAWLERTDPGLVVFEPTGGYERFVSAAVRERGVPFLRVHPNDLVAFRRSRGIKAKTDTIDARLLLAFANDRLTRRELRSSVLGDERLRALAARRRQLVETLQAEGCRLAAAVLPAVRDSIQAVLVVLRHSLDALEAELAAVIAVNPQTAELARLLQTICGIGPVVAMVLVADLPELGLLSNKQIAALVGLAPYTRRSGKTQFRETTGHGRAGVRRALFNAARAALRHPSLFKDFFDRLVTHNRRPGKVALTAVMRKILITANAVARERQPWRGLSRITPPPAAVGTQCRPHGEPTGHRAGRVKAAAALCAVAPSASLDAA